MELSLGQWLVIGICAVLILGYIAGYYYNRQKAGRIQVWLRSGLEKWGEVSVGGKMPGLITGGKLVVNKASAPFQRIEAIYLLAPRENLLFWLFHLLQGRGDELALRIFLPKAPKGGMEAKRNWRSNYIFHGQGAEETWAAFLQKHNRIFSHVALRREAPHLFVRAYLPVLMTDSAGTFLTSLVELIP